MVKAGYCWRFIAELRPLPIADCLTFSSQFTLTFGGRRNICILDALDRQIHVSYVGDAKSRVLVAGKFSNYITTFDQRLLTLITNC